MRSCEWLRCLFAVAIGEFSGGNVVVEAKLGDLEVDVAVLLKYYALYLYKPLT